MRKNQNATQLVRTQWLPNGQPLGIKRLLGMTALSIKARMMNDAVKIGKILDIAPPPYVLAANYRQAIGKIERLIVVPVWESRLNISLLGP